MNLLLARLQAMQRDGNGSMEVRSFPILDYV